METAGNWFGPGKCSKQTLIYPGHMMRPQDVAIFVEMRGFDEEWHRLGLTDEDLSIFQLAIMASPQSYRIRGAGGFRVLAMTSTRNPPQKIQLGYAYFGAINVVLLVMARDDEIMKRLTPEGKRSIASLLRDQRKKLSKRTYS